MRYSIVSILVAFLFIPLAFAHSDLPSFEKTVDGYLIDVGYSIEHPEPKQDVRFTFDLYSGTGDAIAFAPFKAVTFTVSHEGETVFTKTLQNVAPNVPALTYAFPESDTYDIGISYERADGKSEATFQLPVGATSAHGHVDSVWDERMHYILGTGLFLFAAFCIVVMIRQRV